MTTAKEVPKRTKTESAPTQGDDSTNSNKPRNGITKSNYYEFARNWHVAAGTSFIIARYDGQTSTGYRFRKTTREFGAWRAWKKQKGLPTRFMDRQGFDQVPTRWPHQFDESWTEGMSNIAGDKFFDEQVFRERDLQKSPEAMARITERIQKMREVR